MKRRKSEIISLKQSDGPTLISWFIVSSSTAFLVFSFLFLDFGFETIRDIQLFESVRQGIFDGASLETLRANDEINEFTSLGNPSSQLALKKLESVFQMIDENNWKKVQNTVSGDAFPEFSNSKRIEQIIEKIRQEDEKLVKQKEKGFRITNQGDLLRSNYIELTKDLRSLFQNKFVSGSTDDFDPQSSQINFYTAGLLRDIPEISGIPENFGDDKETIETFVKNSRKESFNASISRIREETAVFKKSLVKFRAEKSTNDSEVKQLEAKVKFQRKRLDENLRIAMIDLVAPKQSENEELFYNVAYSQSKKFGLELPEPL